MDGLLKRMVGGEVDLNGAMCGGYRRILFFYFVDGGFTFGRCAAAKKNVIAGGGTAERLDSFKT